MRYSSTSVYETLVYCSIDILQYQYMRHQCIVVFIYVQYSFAAMRNQTSSEKLKKRLWHRCFPENFAKFLRTPFLQNTSGRLLLISRKI